MKRLLEEIRYKRRKIGLTLKEVGHACGCSRAQINNIELGYAPMNSVRRFFMVCKTLDIEPMKFISDPMKSFKERVVLKEDIDLLEAKLTSLKRAHGVSR